MKTKGLFYFAHPYTAKDQDGNYVHAAETANFNLCCYRSGQLLLRGFNVYSPISHTHPIHEATVEFLRNHEHKIWYDLDNEFIDKTDWSGIILAPGWDNSDGCRAERERFVGIGHARFDAGHPPSGRFIQEYDSIIKQYPVIYKPTEGE